MFPLASGPKPRDFSGLLRLQPYHSRLAFVISAAASSLPWRQCRKYPSFRSVPVVPRFPRRRGAKCFLQQFPLPPTDPFLRCHYGTTVPEFFKNLRNTRNTRKSFSVWGGASLARTRAADRGLGVLSAGADGARWRVCGRPTADLAGQTDFYGLLRTFTDGYGRLRTIALGNAGAHTGDRQKH